MLLRAITLCVYFVGQPLSPISSSSFFTKVLANFSTLVFNINFLKYFFIYGCTGSFLLHIGFLWVQFSSAVQSCLTLCNPMDCRMPGFPVHHQLPELAQTCPLSQWCHPTISSSVVPFSCLSSNGNPLQYSCLENPMDGVACYRLLHPWGCRVRRDCVTSLHFTCLP